MISSPVFPPVLAFAVSLEVGRRDTVDSSAMEPLHAALSLQLHPYLKSLYCPRMKGGSVNDQKSGIKVSHFLKKK